MPATVTTPFFSHANTKPDLALLGIRMDGVVFNEQPEKPLAAVELLSLQAT